MRDLTNEGGPSAWTPVPIRLSEGDAPVRLWILDTSPPPSPRSGEGDFDDEDEEEEEDDSEMKPVGRKTVAVKLNSWRIGKALV